MRFKIDWVSLIVGSKYTVFALFCFVFEGNFPGSSPRGGGGGVYLEGLYFYGIQVAKSWFVELDEVEVEVEIEL